MSRSSKRSDRFAVPLLRAASATFGALPPGLGVNLGAAVGAIAHRLLPLRRKVVRENLDFAFGQSHTLEERRRIEAATYRHIGMVGVEFLGLWRHGPEWLDRQIAEVAGLEGIQDILTQKKPFLVLTAHFGSWELLAAYFGLRYNVSVLAKPLHNAALDRELTAQRRRYGLEILTSTDATVAREILRTVRAGRIVGFLADQDARRAGIFAPFFGRPASTFAGPALMAVRLKMPLIPIFLMRLGPGRHRVLIRAPLYPPAGLSTEEAVARLTAAHVKVLEDVIRMAPSQYFWFHRRWKTSPRKSDRIVPAPELESFCRENAPPRT